MTDRTVTLELFLHDENDMSWQVSEDETDMTVWIPRSKCTIGDEVAPDVFEFTIPEWIARDRGLI